MPKLEEKDYSYLETGPAKGFVSPEFEREVKKSKKLSEKATESPAKPTLSESKTELKDRFEDTKELSKEASADFKKLMNLIRENQAKNKFTPSQLE